MNKEIELKPCPFCKCEMRIKSDRDWHVLWGEHTDDCILDDVESSAAATNGQLEILINDWNTRPIEAQLQAENERLRSLLAAKEWKPIETAPKDREFLCETSAGEISVGFWNEFGWSEKDGDNDGSGKFECEAIDEPVLWQDYPPASKAALQHNEETK